MKQIFIILLSILCFGLMSNAQVQVLPSNQNISYEGVLYPLLDSSLAILNRHTEESLLASSAYVSYEKARTQTGIVIRFKTASPNITLSFQTREDGNQSSALQFRVYEDGVVNSTISDSVLSINSVSPNTVSLFEVVLPVNYAVDFLGMEIDNGFDLIPILENPRPVYMTFGNSITHGRGQLISDETYGFQIARKRGWEYYNLAVGGSKIVRSIQNIQVRYPRIIPNYDPGRNLTNRERFPFFSCHVYLDES